MKRAEHWKIGKAAVSRILLAGMLIAGGATLAQAQNKIGPPAPVTYDNRYEVYGGLSFMNFQAGQNLPTRMNLGGGEVSLTYWLTNRLGLTGDYRGEAGTTPVFPSAPTPPSKSYIDRPLVYMNMGMGGVQWRGPKNQYAALNLHGYFGMSHGVFDGGTGGVPPENVGLYTNRTKPIAALGGSVDINRSKNWAIRLSPDLILEHFGTETREFFSISGGVVYRFGQR
ncbi:MAG TPA: hypothetical protein VFE38_02180 [Edaphobacter sp.]|nr:hypothetical protein [Edaphobacter sp.]